MVQQAVIVWQNASEKYRCIPLNHSTNTFVAMIVMMTAVTAITVISLMLIAVKLPSPVRNQRRCHDVVLPAYVDASLPQAICVVAWQCAVACKSTVRWLKTLRWYSHAAAAAAESASICIDLNHRSQDRSFVHVIHSANNPSSPRGTLPAFISDHFCRIL